MTVVAGASLSSVGLEPNLLSRMAAASQVGTVKATCPHILMVGQPQASPNSVAGEINPTFSGRNRMHVQRWEECLADITDSVPPGHKALSVVMTPSLYSVSIHCNLSGSL